MNSRNRPASRSLLPGIQILSKYQRQARCSLSSASHRPTGGVFNNTRDKTDKGVPESSTYPFLRAQPSIPMKSSPLDNESVSTLVADREEENRGKRERKEEKSGLNFIGRTTRGERGRKSVPRRPGETINSACCSIFHRAICKSGE